MNRPVNENTPRVVAVALAFFGGLAALGLASGVFTRLGPELTFMLGAFATAFAILTYHLDAGVRGWVKRLVAPRRRVNLKGRIA
jgi:hypothetical protein